MTRKGDGGFFLPWACKEAHLCNPSLHVNLTEQGYSLGSVPEAHCLYRGTFSPSQRTACPGEGKAELGSSRTFNMTMSSDAVLSSIFRSQPVFPTSPTSAQPAGSKLDMEVAVISSSLPEGSPELRNMQQSPSDPHASEVTVSGQQQGQLPTTDIQDLLLRLQDTHVQSLMQKLQQLMAMGKAVEEEELQAVALKLLVALNNASVSPWAKSTDTGRGREE